MGEVWTPGGGGGARPSPLPTEVRKLWVPKALKICFDQKWSTKHTNQRHQRRWRRFLQTTWRGGGDLDTGGGGGMDGWMDGWMVLALRGAAPWTQA